MVSKRYRVTHAHIRWGRDFLVAHRVGPRGGRGAEIFVADPWIGKGFWLLYYRYENHVYRIWTATPERREVLAWLRWFESDSFRQEHARSLRRRLCRRPCQKNPKLLRLRRILAHLRPHRRGMRYLFETNPQHPAEGVWLGWRHHILRSPEPTPEWLEFCSRQGCVLQRYRVRDILGGNPGKYVSLRRLAVL